MVRVIREEKSMADFENRQHLLPQSSDDLAPSLPVDSRPDVSSATAPPSFDPSRSGLPSQKFYARRLLIIFSKVIGIIRRKALIKDLAAVYHGECLSVCQELLELQRECEESYAEIKAQEDTRKGRIKGPKRLKRSS